MYELRLTKNAENDLRALDARFRAAVIAAMRAHLTHEPAKTSKSRIKRLRDLKLPQYRLRVDEIRVYYDIGEDYVMIYGIISKERTFQWLDEHGIPNDHSTPEPS
jgi:mRNA-degrading endonuclease RelE of RelBE toxin-antitoxin system